MKKRSLKKFQIKTYSAVKDDEGNVIETYSDEANEDVCSYMASIFKTQTELYGMRDKWYLEYALLWFSSN